MKPPNMKPVAAGMAAACPLVMLTAHAPAAVLIVGLALVVFAVVLGWRQDKRTRAEALISITLGLLGTVTVVGWNLLGWPILIVDALAVLAAKPLSAVTFAPLRTKQNLYAAGWGHNCTSYYDEEARRSIGLSNPRLFNLDGTGPTPHNPPVGDLTDQWAQLDTNWVVHATPMAATIVGPPGVVRLENIVADDIIVTDTESSAALGDQHAADETVALAATSWREALSDSFVNGSESQKELRKFDYVSFELDDLTTSVQAARDRTWVACHDLPDNVDVQLGFMAPELPWGPVRMANEKAAELGFPANYSSPVLYVLHGARMDVPYGRVHIYHDRIWMGQVWVVHPKHVAELLNSLPCVMHTNAQLHAAIKAESAHWA